MHRHQALTLTLWLACGCSAGVTVPDAAMPEGDPCVPGGHVHREPAGDWCHCDRGSRATTAQLGCEPDPNFTGATTVDFTGTAERACWHASNGPFRAVVEDGRADDFLTHFTLGLESPDGGTLREASVRYRAALTSAHVATLSRGVNFSVDEVLPSGGLQRVPILVTEVTTLCPELSQQFGFELVSGAEYRFRFGPSLAPEVGFVVDQAR